MVESIINSIIEAESKAAAELKAAHTTAKDILFNAETEKENIKESVVKEVKTLVKSIVDDAEAKASAKSEKIIAKGNKEAETLKSNVKDKKDSAIDLIVGRIVSKYGNN